MRLPLRLSPLLLAAACAATEGDDGGASAAAETTPPFTDTTATSMPMPSCGTGSTRGCYTNYAITADLDGDGNLDIVMANGGGHFTAGTAEPQVVYFGDGHGAFTDGSAAFITGLQKAITRQVAIADFDGDGRLDVYFPAGYGGSTDQLFYQRGPKAFENDPVRLAGGLRSRAGGVHAGDIDGDGDMDLVVADWGLRPNPDGALAPSPVKVRLYSNDGAGRFSTGPVYDAPNGSTATDVDLADIDGDFDLDLILNQRNGQSRLFLNDGTGSFTDATATLAFPAKRGPFSFNAELCDLDHDGDLDLLFDGAARSLIGHSSQLLINDGAGRFVDETEARIAGEPKSDDNQLKCADVDNDGHLDLLVASLSNPSEKLLKNDGTGHFTNVTGAFPRLGDPTLAIDVGDFDGDGRLDVLTAQGEVPGQSWLERIYRGATTTAVDIRPPVFRAVEHPAGVADRETVIRFAVTDSHTSETGQHVKNVGVDVTIAGETRTIAAKFIGGDLFRAVVPAAAAGTTMTVVPTATDRAGNIGRGASFDIVVPAPVAPPAR